MAKTYLYKHPDGRETAFLLTALKTIELEQRLGGSISEKLQEFDKLSVASEFIAASFLEGDYSERKGKALELFEEIVDNGGTIIDYQFIVIGILKNSGFMTAQRAEMYHRLMQTQEALLSRAGNVTEASQN